MGWRTERFVLVIGGVWIGCIDTIIEAMMLVRFLTHRIPVEILFRMFQHFIRWSGRTMHNRNTIKPFGTSIRHFHSAWGQARKRCEWPSFRNRCWLFCLCIILMIPKDRHFTNLPTFVYDNFGYCVYIALWKCYSVLQLNYNHTTFSFSV